MRAETGIIIARRTYIGALLALAAFVATGAFLNGAFFLTQPYQLNYGEGLAAWQASRITDLARSYAPIDHYPFVVLQYPPLFHWAMHAAGTITGGDLLQAGRLVSLLSAVILCGLVKVITFTALPRRAHLTPRLLAAGFAAALPTALYNFNWTWLARVDTLAILLSFGGVALFAVRARSAWAQVLAAVLLTAGLFTKQTALAAPLACILTAFLLDRKIALRILLTMTILGGLVLGWLAWRTDGQVFLHLFRYNQNAFSIGRAMFGVLMNGSRVIGPFVLAAGASAWVLARAWSTNVRANRYRRTVFLLSLYSIFAALSTLAFGKEGSDINYFLEWNISLAPLAGMFLFRLRPPRLCPVWLAALAVPVLILSAAVPQARMGWVRFFDKPLPSDREQLDTYRRVLALVAETTGPVFSEDMNLLYKSGKDIPAEPAMIQCLAKAGTWDERPFVRMIQEHQFAMVITMLNRETDDQFSPRRYSSGVASAIKEAYEQTSMIGDYQIYQPR